MTIHDITMVKHTIWFWTIFF